ncbi:MAG: RAD55 family ATPase [Anaerolineales bacterium]
MSDRVPTGIRGFDDMLHGGYLPVTANLVEGAPGTGKSTLGMQFIYSGATQYDEPGLVLTFEEFPHQFYQSAASFGWDLRALEAADKLRVVMTSPEASMADLQQTGSRIAAMATELAARRVLVDSLSHFERMAPEPRALRDLIFTFVNALKREQLTVVLTRESVELLGAVGSAAVEEDISFITDSYTLLRYVEIDSAIQRALLVLKLRGSAHANDIRRYEITGRGLEVQSKFEGQQGLMSGSPQRMAESFVKAFVES